MYTSRFSVREFWEKEKLLLKLGVPTWLLAFIQLGLSFITIAFAGTISERMLAGVGLGNTMYNVMLWSVLLGFTSVLDTFGPQVFASPDNKAHLGTVALKICLQGVLVYLVIIGPYLNSVHVVRLLPAEGDVGNSTVGWHNATHGMEGDPTDTQPTSIQITVQYMRLVCVVPLMDFWVSIVSKYLTIQHYICPVYLISLLMILLHVSFNGVLVLWGEWGLVGLVLAAVLTRVCTMVMLLAYCYSKRRMMAWPGFTSAALEDWGESLQLGVSGAVNMFVELGMFEIATFFSQFNGTTTLATIVVMFQFISIIYTIPYGISTAATILIGDALGSGDKDLIKKYMKLVVLNTVVLGVLIAAIFYLFRYYLVLIFTADSAVINMFASATCVMLLEVPFDHLQTVLSRGILIAFGKQRFIAVSLAVICYMIATPLMLVFVFETNLGATGIFLCFLVFAVLNSAVCGVRISLLDIDREIVKAADRAALDTQDSIYSATETTPLTAPARTGSRPARRKVLVAFIVAALAAALLTFTSSLDFTDT